LAGEEIVSLYGPRRLIHHRLDRLTLAS
jgi:hypothetical protein